MGTITMSAQTAAGTVTKAFPVTDANILRIAEFAKATIGPSGPTPITNAEAIERWMKWALEMTRAHVVEHEKRAAVVPDLGIE